MKTGHKTQCAAIGSKGKVPGVAESRPAEVIQGAI